MTRDKILQILLKMQEELESTKGSLVKLQDEYEALKGNQENSSGKFNSTTLDHREKDHFIEALRIDRQILTECVLKMLRIFQKQNYGILENEIKDSVNLFFFLTKFFR